MEKYVLNETPVRTTSNFKINDIKVDLDLPKDLLFHNFDIIGDTSKLEITTIEGKSLNSKIGLTFDKSLDLSIKVKKGVIIENPIYITYNFRENDNLISNIKIDLEEDSKANFIFKYKSLTNGKNFCHIKEVITGNKNSRANITILNLLNENSTNFTAVELKEYENSSINHNIIDLGGNISISNFYGELLEYNSTHYLNNIYFGNKENKIDINYHIKNIGKNTKNYINVEGALTDNSIKHFKGTIDFIKGSSKSIGEENENCILLSDTCKSRSLPMLLCEEENVEGAHGVSSGKIDFTKLFYLMSRGLTEKEAEKLLVIASFNKIIRKINSEEIEKEVLDLINTLI